MISDGNGNLVESKTENANQLDDLVLASAMEVLATTRAQHILHFLSYQTMQNFAKFKISIWVIKQHSMVAMEISLKKFLLSS